MSTAPEFRKFAHAMVDYIIDYTENVRSERVLPTVEPGYLLDLLPQDPPEHPEKWQDIMKDIDRVIMPGVTHWQSPNFHAYYPVGNSYPSVVADLLSSGIGALCFSWITSPAYTELEMCMMDWLAKMIGLPEEFLFSSHGTGGGVIQGTASEAALVALLSARVRAVKEYSQGQESEHIMEKLICYTSDQSHSSGERSAMMGGVKMRSLPTDDDVRLHGDTLAKAIEEDRSKGLIPFFLMASLGTTISCAFDDLDELGKVCQREKLWLHVDAAYAGSALICPEYRHYLNGIEYVDSFTFNPHKWLLVSFDCSAMWVRDSEGLANSFNVNPSYLSEVLKTTDDIHIPEYRHWQLPLGTRFRSLKLWFVIRLFGQEGLRNHIRDQIKLAHEFENMVSKDDRFEITAPVTMGLVCFRMKGPDELTQKLSECLKERGQIFLIHSKLHGVYMLRFVVCSRTTNLDDVKFAWKEITYLASHILKGQPIENNVQPTTSNISHEKVFNFTSMQHAFAVLSHHFVKPDVSPSHIAAVTKKCLSDFDKNVLHISEHRHHHAHCNMKAHGDKTDGP